MVMRDWCVGMTEKSVSDLISRRDMEDGKQSSFHFILAPEGASQIIGLTIGQTRFLPCTNIHGREPYRLTKQSHHPSIKHIHQTWHKYTHLHATCTAPHTMSVIPTTLHAPATRIDSITNPSELTVLQPSRWPTGSSKYDKIGQFSNPHILLTTPE